MVIGATAVGIGGRPCLHTFARTVFVGGIVCSTIVRISSLPCDILGFNFVLVGSGPCGTRGFGLLGVGGIAHGICGFLARLAMAIQPITLGRVLAEFDNGLGFTALGAPFHAAPTDTRSIGWRRLIVSISSC